VDRDVVAIAVSQADFSRERLLVAALLFLGFIAVVFAGSIILPGPKHAGAVLADGSRKTYKLNGLALFLLLASAMVAAHQFEWFPLSVVHRHFWALFAVADVFAFVLTLALYVKGRRQGIKPRAGASGFLKDCYMGTEINPSWLGVDLKMFSYRPSLMGLGVINWSFAALQYEQLGRLTTRMWLYQLFTFVYLANASQTEHGMLYMWDVLEEKFGWMLVWGDYVLVPSEYCRVARFRMIPFVY
jgi:delta14-sterol reductase